MPFVAGVARSWTTLLRLMLDAHPETYHRTAHLRLDEVETHRRPDGQVIITKEERLHNHPWRRALIS